MRGIQDPQQPIMNQKRSLKAELPIFHSSLLKAWSFHQHFLLTVAVLRSTNYEFHEDFLWNLHQYIIKSRGLPKLQKKKFWPKKFWPITVSGSLPPGEVVPRQLARWWLSSGKLSPGKVTPTNNHPSDKSPKWLPPGWLLTKKVTP